MHAVNPTRRSQNNVKHANVADVKAHFDSAFPEFNELTESEDITLTCELSDGDASVNWLLNGKPLPDNGRYTVKADGVVRSLTIKGATIADSGDYACVTADGRSKTVGEVKVNGNVDCFQS